MGLRESKCRLPMPKFSCYLTANEYYKTKDYV